MQWKIALIIVLVWFLASLVGLIVRSVRMGTRLLTGLTVFCVAVFAYYLWLGWIATVRHERITPVLRISNGLSSLNLRQVRPSNTKEESKTRRWVRSFKHANKNRLGAIDLGPNDFDVLDTDRCIGRIFLSPALPPDRNGCGRSLHASIRQRSTIATIQQLASKRWRILGRSG
jgi:hypothetical protein